MSVRTPILRALGAIVTLHAGSALAEPRVKGPLPEVCTDVDLPPLRSLSKPDFKNFTDAVVDLAFGIGDCMNDKVDALLQEIANELASDPTYKGMRWEDLKNPSYMDAHPELLDIVGKRRDKLFIQNGFTVEEPTPDAPTQ